MLPVPSGVGWGTLPSKDGSVAATVPSETTGTSPTQDAQAATASVQASALAIVLPPPPAGVLLSIDPSGALLMWLNILVRRVGGTVSQNLDDINVLESFAGALGAGPDVDPFASMLFQQPTSQLSAFDAEGQSAIFQFAVGQGDTYIGSKGTVNPLIDGTASSGTSGYWTPIDHIHPTDTSRQATLGYTAANKGGDTFTGSVAFSSTVGFNGTSPISKPTVTGSRAGNAALASALTALANYGLITDSSSA